MLFNYNTTPDWNDITVLQRNKLPARAYFIPYESKAKYAGNFYPEKSSFVTVLNGQWQFRYYESAMDLPDNVVEKPKQPFKQINVPSVWQATGIEPPFYLNVAYAFPPNCPKIPMQNPVGVYYREFEIEELADHYILTFLGVSSSFHVYINGAFVGYSEGSHNAAEFNVKTFIQEGKNTICVLVYKWCNGSYLECQDMFRSNGIFRDVFLTAQPSCYIYDVCFKTVSQENGFLCKLSVQLSGNYSDCMVIAELFGGKETVKKVRVEGKEFTEIEFIMPSPKLWSAEIPNIYDLSITLEREGMSFYNLSIPVGFRDIQTKNGIFTVNGVPIKCKGVNHHDSHPVNGYCLTVADLQKDVELIKEFNINTVRTSHYPSHPVFMELCDRFGLYVIDEADIESHGELYLDSGAGTFSNDEQFFPLFWDRVERLYYRDRNHPCIIMWSLGNESGIGKNHFDCYEKLKSLDSSLPIHYEGAQCLKDQYGFDVISNMYPSLEQMQHVLDISPKEKPYFLCEYGHAMGVGPGGVEKYWEFFYENPRCMGGCIWEWCDHVIEVNGKYVYGGESGEYLHDSNFCVDGLFYPDRTPSRSAFEIKNIYRPVRSKLFKDTLIFKNTQSFLTSDGLQIVLTLLVDGIEIAQKSYALSILPLKEQSIKIPFSALNSGLVHLNIDYVRIDNQTVIGFEQHTLKTERTVKIPVKSNITVNKIENGYQINTSVYQAIFDCRQGNLVSLCTMGYELFNQNPISETMNPFQKNQRGFLPNLYRYCIDNDMYSKIEWERIMLDKLWHMLYDIHAEIKENEAVFTLRSVLSPPKFSKLFETEFVYHFRAEDIQVDCSLIPCKEGLPFLPRFGVKCELNGCLENIRYFGLGSEENYCDYKEATRLGIYKNSVSKLCSPQIRPQEGGNRSEVEWFEVTESKFGKGLRIEAVKESLNMSAFRFDTSKFKDFKHDYDVKDMGITELLIDGFMSGVGSNSCGPLPEDCFRLHADSKKTFSFKLIPLKGKNLS